MQDEGNESDMEDTDNAHIPKVLTTTWFKPIPESERPDTPEPEWTIPPRNETNRKEEALAKLILEGGPPGQSQESLSTEDRIDQRKLMMLNELQQYSDGNVDRVAVSSSLRLLEPKRTIESRAKRSSINLVRTQHPSETMVFHNEDGESANTPHKQALVGYLKDGDGDGNSQLLRYQVNNRMLRHDLHLL
ncbi:hypothetical protein Tco_0431649 [Tanacetum coccineum]